MYKVNRRGFLKQSSIAGTSAFALTMAPTRLLAQKGFNQSLPYVSLRSHLLNRTSFGINAQSKSLYDEMGYRDYIEYQLNPNTIDDSELEDYISQFLPTVNMSVVETRELINNDELTPFRVADELVYATYLRAIYSNKQLLQVMVEFWSNHFSVFHFDGPIPVLKSKEDREVIRPLALSTFSELLHADAKSSAMIYYLDTYASNKEAPNENYARELMELHTLGVDGPYNHHDIDEVARCFTGWTINTQNGDFRYIAQAHDEDEKTVLGNSISAGGGVTDGEQVLDILANNEATAVFLAQKLCRHFIADNPDESIVESTTGVFISSNGDIKSCLRHILLSKHFMISADLKLKRPFHYLTSVTRSLNANVSNFRATRELLAALGQRPFSWQSPDGFPDFSTHWESTSGMLFRWNYANSLSFGELPGYNYVIDELILQPHTPENILSQIIEKVIHREMTNYDSSALIEYLQEQAIDNVVPLIKIQGALAIALGSPYFQLC